MKKIGDYLQIEELFATTEASPIEGHESRSLIKGFLKLSTPVKVLYMASLEFDNMEMIESFRMSIEPGSDVFELPHIAVINPIRSDDNRIGNYTLTLKIYASGGVVHEFSTGLRFE